MSTYHLVLLLLLKWDHHIYILDYCYGFRNGINTYILDYEGPKVSFDGYEIQGQNIVSPCFFFMQNKNMMNFVCKTAFTLSFFARYCLFLWQNYGLRIKGRNYIFSSQFWSSKMIPLEHHTWHIWFIYFHKKI